MVVVGADGSVSTSGFAGALDLSNGVKVRLCGEVNKLAPGEYTIAQTAGLTFSASGNSVVSDVPFKRNLSLGINYFLSFTVILCHSMSFNAIEKNVNCEL